MRILRLQAGGLVGGHSGVDINAGRANANLLVARTLRRLLGCLDLALLAIHGGSAPNAIPRDAQALLAVPPDAVERAEAMVSELQEAARREYRGVEERLALTIAPAPEQPVASALASASARRLVDLLLELPNGVASMSTEFPGTVQTSNNLGVLRSLESSIQIVSSQRSSSAQELASLTNRIEQAATLAGASSTTGTSYPPWRPRLDSPLLGRCREVWRARHGRDPEVRVIHAGLECAVIGMRCPGMDMVSLGPTIEDAHSPRERLSIPSLAAVQRYLSDLLASLAS
jgi:dipeptidase D